MFDPVGGSSQNICLIADVIELDKDEKGHVGIAIGGGAPNCPCLYIVQIFDNSPAKRNGLLGVGDELVSVNGQSLRGYEKSAVAALIRKTKGPVRISFNRLQFDSEKGQSLDILLKKFKHRLVDAMDDTTADALGLSRAILCNDVLSQLQHRLERNQRFYNALIKKAEDQLTCYRRMATSQATIGAVLAQIAAKEQPTTASDESNQLVARMATVNRTLGNQHQAVSHRISEMVKALQCHANAAIPDVKQSLAAYLDAKYEYLSYCLRAKELEDEEAETTTLGEHLSRMDSGNYEYRITLKLREHSRGSFMERRKQVAVKIELLDEKHVRELALQLKNLINTIAMAQTACRDEVAKDCREPT